MSPTLPNLVLWVALLWFLFEMLSLIALAWEIPSASRAIYHKARGHLVVTIPDDIRVAAANGLIREGSEVVVGASHEGNGGVITRFAIHPSLVRRPVGTMLRVVAIRSKRLILEELRRPRDAQ